MACGSGLAAPPAPPPAGGAAAPAVTSWQKYPGTTVTPPTPSVAPPPQLPGASPPGSRVVVFTKPSGGGEVRPAQAIAPDKKAEEKKQEERPVDAFRLRTDEELRTEIDQERKLEERKRQYAEDMKRYAIELKEFKDGVREKMPTEPFKPGEVPLLELPGFQPAAVVKAGYGPAQAVLEPGYVVHRRLFFEEKNSDRYGWDLGFAQPFVSAGVFYKDVLFWPSKLTSNLFERYDTSAGKCPPGSPVAYYLYPPNITLKGGLVQTAAVVGTIALMP